MIHNRLVAFLWPIFAFTLGGVLLLAIVASFAHADTGAQLPPDVLGLEGRLAAWAIAAYAIARTVLELLKVIAPRTRTPVDDEVRDALARILADARPPAPRQPPSSIAGSIGILVLGAGLALQPACATVERAGGAAKVAALDCGVPKLATAAALVARWAVEDALAGKIQWAKHETDAIAFGLGVGSCAYAEFLRAWKAQPRPQALALAAQPDPIADAEAGLERLRARLGGAQIKLADGTVL